MAKKQGFALQEHIDIGRTLIDTRGKLSRVRDEIYRAYGHKGAKLNRAAERALTALDELRSILDAEVFQENPNRPGKENALTYYG